MSHSRPRIRYYWRGLTENRQPVKGYIVAPNKTIAKMLLNQQGVRIKWLTQTFFFSRMIQRINAQEILELLRQLALLLHAGLPLLSALNTLKLNHYNPQMDLFIEQIKQDIQEGKTLAYVLRQYPQYCNSMLCSLVEAGEQSSMLVAILLKFSRYHEQMLAIQKKFKTILIYPGLLFLITFIISFLLLHYVVPEFVNLFQQFGSPLPWPTQWCIKLSQITREYGLMLVSLMGLSIAGVKSILYRSSRFKYFIAMWVLKIPLLTHLIEKSITARFCYTLALILHAGIPLLEGLRLVAPTTGNYFTQQAIIKISEQIREGLSLSQALHQTRAFSPTIIQMIAIGEESGKLESMLLHIAKQQEDAFFNLALISSRMLEPVLMILLGTWIGALIIAMYLPIFYLGVTI